MPLSVEVKPGERIRLGEYDLTITERTRLIFHTESVPFLREKDMLAPDAANTPAKRLYLTLQLMYLSKDPHRYEERWVTLLNEVLRALPSATQQVESIRGYIAQDQMYKALKDIKNLIDYEHTSLSAYRSKRVHA
jgi:flagellar biosynthesis repressor protein FlbT